MKTFAKRFLSILLAVFMIIAFVPQAAGTMNAEAANSSKSGSSQNLPISLNGVNYTRGQAMATETLDYSQSGSNITWKHPSSFNEMKKLLESTKEEDRYICLTEDREDTWKGDVVEPINISSNKVLDLNGHSIEFHVDSTLKHWTYWGIEQAPYMRDDVEHHMATAFEITKKANFYILDSSAKNSYDGKTGSGKIRIIGRMQDPFKDATDYGGPKHEYKHYSNLDLFNVNNGNLIIYGGNFQAGRIKSQVDSNFSWEKLKSTIGKATELAVSVASYATGIEAAVAAADDVNESFAKLTSEKDDVSSTNTNKNEKPEETTKSPDGKTSLKTVGDKQDSVDKSGKANSSENGAQKANEKGSAKTDKDKETGKNSKIAEAQKKVIDSALDQSKITDMVNKAFDFATSIVGMMGSNESTRIVETMFGTCVYCGNGGTFVSYGGTYNGYGSSPNTRNAVIETTRQGKAYIFDGTFNARAGANVFNIVKTGTETVQQMNSDKNGNVTPETVTVEMCENMNHTQIFYEDDGETPVDTSNIVVRGGTFRNYYEAKNIGLIGEDDDHFSTWYGTPGGVNLGIGSYGEDFIKDGRIQIDDMFGDGALVLMDEDSGGNGDIYHYRLFCSDLELRYKQGLRVYPNTAETNTTNGFALKTQYQHGDESSVEEVLSNDQENIRGTYNTMEKVFFFPINDNATAGYRINPTFKDVDPDGSNLSSSTTWYYLSPTDTLGNEIEPLVLEDQYIAGTLKSSATGNYQTADPNKITNSFNSTLNTTTSTFGDTTYVDYRTVSNTSSKNLHKVFVNYNTFNQSYNYVSNLKWLEFKIYQVDPLTRLNIRSTDQMLGDEAPLATATYGYDAKKVVNTQIVLTDLEEKIKAQNTDWKGFQQGEMYRITLSVEERLNHGYDGYDKYAANTALNDYDEYSFTTNVGTAKASSSLLFMCYGPDETTVKEGSTTAVPDYTPLQWWGTGDGSWSPGQKFYVRLINGKTGNVDWETNRIFDVYYQWWTIDENGEKEDLLAGTTNVWDVATLYAQAKEQGLNTEDTRTALNKNKDNHTLGKWLRGQDGFKYKNILAPDDPLLDAVDINGNKVVYADDGLPVIEYNANGTIKSGTNLWPKDNDQASRLIHAYSTGWRDDEYLKLNKYIDLDNVNNKQDYGYSDSLYIPNTLAGKRIMAEAIVVNVNWTDYYDAVQTFYSHPITIGQRMFDEDLNGTVSLTYGDKGAYASIDNEATISLDSVEGLADDEYVTSVDFRMQRGNVIKWHKEYTLNKEDKLPAAKFMSDFLEESEIQQGGDYTYTVPAAQDLEFLAVIETNLGRKARTMAVPGRLEVEAEGVIPVKDSYTFDIEEIKSGKYNSGDIQLFTVYPVNYTVGMYYGSAASTDKNVAYIDLDGTLAFGGSAGEAVLSFTDPSGSTNTITVKIIDYMDDVVITNINPPSIGETFPTDIEIPENADYEVQEVYWVNEGTGEVLKSDAVARNYKVYSINMVIKKKAGTVFRESNGYDYRNYHPFTLYANTTDGGVDAVMNKWENGKINYVEDPVTGVYGPGDTCTYKYIYYEAKNAAPNPIKEVNMDYPTEVTEGDSVDDWMDKFIVSTSGDDTEFLFKKGFTFTSFAEQTFAAYGYDVDMENPTDTMKAFMKGTVEGPRVDIDLDPDDENNTARFAAEDELTVNVNGDTNENTDMTVSLDSKFGMFTVPGTITIVDGKAIPVLPRYRVLDFNLAEGEEVDLDDLLVTEDDNIRLILDETQMSKELTSYIKYYAEDNILTGKKDSDGSQLTIPLYVAVDGDGDGEADMRVNCNVKKQIYADPADWPALNNGYEINVGVKVLNPDGTQAYAGNYKAIKESQTAESAELDIPVVDGAFMTEVVRKRSNDSFTYEFGTWAGRIVADLKDGDEITVYTRSVNEIKVKTASTEIYPDFEGVNNLCVSLDGDHWTASKVAFTGLEPDTEYLLYYRQGVDDVFYTRVVKTNPDGDDLGVYVGRNPVTRSDLGNLERDGYQYDPETRTLTLKNFNFKDMGIDVESFKVLAYNRRAQSVIYSKEDLTIELVGDNYLEKTGGESTFILGNIIRAEGDITFTGKGDITLIGTSLCQAVQAGSGKNIYLKGTGRQIFGSNDTEGILSAYHTIDGGKVYYTNGELDFNHCTTAFSDGTNHASDNFVTTSATHSFKIYAGTDDGVEVTHISLSMNDESAASDRALVMEHYNEGAITSEQCKYVHLVPQHSFTKEIAEDDYYVSGDCSKGTEYYKSCGCGASDHDHTFTVAAGNHDIVHHEGLAPTCTEDGYKEYDTCTRCGYTTFEVIHSEGHTFKHHDEVAPTCEKDGCPAYDECTVCGYCSLEPTILAAIKGENPEAVERDDLWVATGHDVYYVPEKAPESCGVSGTHEHYECAHCKEAFADEAAAIEVSKKDIEITIDHQLVWVPAVEATAEKDGNIEYYVCEECGKFFSDIDGKHEITDKSSVIISIKPNINKTKATLAAGKTVTLKVTNGMVKSWKSSKAAVAAVSSKGVVTAKKKGSATITATLSDGTKLTCKITVSSNPTIKVGKKAFKAKTTYTVKKGKTLTVTITGKAPGVNNVYSTSKKKVAKVTSKNTATKVKIKGLKAGKATVTIKVNGVAFKIKVKVKK